VQRDVDWFYCNLVLDKAAINVYYNGLTDRLRNAEMAPLASLAAWSGPW
jgi:hypothetical protein